MANDAWDFRNKKKFDCIFDKASHVKKQIIELSKKYKIKNKPWQPNHTLE